jgi:hypothetical protein
MQTRFVTYVHALTDTILCPKCGSAGVIKWDSVETPSGRRKDFAGLSGNFYERLSAKPPYPIEIVCGDCDLALLNEGIPSHTLPGPM